MPVSAVILGGTERVKLASRSAPSGASASSMRATFVSPRVMTAKFVTSEPVPAVVGIARKYGWARPFCSAKYRMAFVASMQEPPPNAMTTSGLAPKIMSTPASTSSWLGSGRTLEYTLTCAPDGRYWVILLTMPDSCRKPSVTTRTLVHEREERCSTACGPKNSFALRENSFIFLLRFR